MGSRGVARLHGLLLLAAVFATAWPGSAQAQASGSTAVAPDEGAVVEFYNRRIVVLRAPLGASSPQERAAGAEQRFQALRLSRYHLPEVTTRAVPEGIVLSVGDRRMFTVTPADVDTLLGETPESVATAAANHAREALRAYAEQHNAKRLLIASAQVLAATLLLVLAIRLLVWVHRAVSRRLAAKQEAARRVLTLGDFQVLDVVRLQAFTERGFALLLWILGFALLDIWLTFSLKRFPYTRVWGESIQSWFFGQLKMLGQGAIGALPGLVTVVIIFVLARLLTRVLVQFFVAVQAGRVTLPWLHPDTAPPTLRIVLVLLWLFAIMIAYPFMPGSGSGVFKGITLFAGAVFSLGSSALVGQFMSGLVLMYSRAFRRGDYVRVGEVEGTILELGMLSTKIRTNKRELVTIPNSVVVGHETKNYSRLAEEAGVIISTGVTIGYDVPWRQVHAMLEEAAARTAKLKREPPPYVYQMALSDFYVEYQLHAYLEFPNERVPVLAALHANIQDLFNENGVQIMSPHFESQPERKVYAPREVWYAPPAQPPDGAPAKPPESAPAKPPKGASAKPPDDAPAPRVGE